MKKSLASEYPELVNEWDYELNGDIKPSDVPPKGRQHVWWNCQEGHPSYKAKLASRSNGTGCPCCKGSEVCFERSLLGKRPDLVAMWDKERNSPSTPDKVLAGSNETYYWICEKGHSFDMPIKRMTRKRRSNGCPYCRGLRVNETNNLAKLYPQIAYEWVECLENKYKTAKDVTPGSTVKVLWRCKRGHEWKTTPKHRTSGGTGCPRCKKTMKVSKKSYTLFYYLRKHFDDVEIERPLLGTRMVLDVYIPSINLVIEYDGGFYHKDNKRDIKKDSMLLEKMPTAKLIRIREPECPPYNSPNSNTIFYVLKNHSIEAFQMCLQMVFIDHVQKRPDINLERDNVSILELMDCLECENSFATIRPDLLIEFDYKKNGNLKPEDFKVASKEKVNWICKKGHCWSATIASRTHGGNNCPDCGNRRLHSGNNLAAVNPELVKEWHPTKNEKGPQDYFANSHFKVWWLCKKCGYEWPALIYNRNGKRSGCPLCYRNNLN
ncbi:zinc-ribbon domain-containing protein [Bacillus sp. V2I10]|uniref:zinc-ribbon domain-containing protein n=1 Tax=Bacillus sp. V2I10 TaxID=3042276 RepID=UPI002781D25C|nr:zinc-ribbon domain-containing protein [Bacillus sp. V2I10]MDQ0856695.1 very-short-patch-repair endonuclease [Bacillus sp. V2I10]